MSTEQALVEELARVTEERDRLMEINWQHVRVQAAIAAMQGLLANPDEGGSIIAQEAVWYADKLIAELQKEVAK